jgi:hypothetical protein
MTFTTKDPQPPEKVNWHSAKAVSGLNSNMAGRRFAKRKHI